MSANVTVTALITPDTRVEVRAPRENDPEQAFTLAIGDGEVYLYADRVQLARTRDVLAAALDIPAGSGRPGDAR